MIGMGLIGGGTPINNIDLITGLGSVDPPHSVGQIVGLLAMGRIIPVEQFTRMRIKRIHHLTVNVLLDPFQIAVKWCIALTLNAPYLLPEHIMRMNSLIMAFHPNQKLALTQPQIRQPLRRAR